jgi:hypothetical protein
MINTQHPLGEEEFTSPTDSMTYGTILSKLFIVSILGTRLLGAKKILFRSASTEVQEATDKRPWLRNHA